MKDVFCPHMYNYRQPKKRQLSYEKCGLFLFLCFFVTTQIVWCPKKPPE